MLRSIVSWSLVVTAVCLAMSCTDASARCCRRGGYYGGRGYYGGGYYQNTGTYQTAGNYAVQGSGCGTMSTTPPTQPQTAPAPPTEAAPQPAPAPST